MYSIIKEDLTEMDAAGKEVMLSNLSFEEAKKILNSIKSKFISKNFSCDCSYDVNSIILDDIDIYYGIQKDICDNEKELLDLIDKEIEWHKKEEEY